MSDPSSINSDPTIATDLTGFDGPTLVNDLNRLLQTPNHAHRHEAVFQPSRNGSDS